MDENILSQVRWQLERFKKNVDNEEVECLDKVLKQLKELVQSLRGAAGIIYDNLPDPEFEEERKDAEEVGDQLQALSRNADHEDPWRL